MLDEKAILLDKTGREMVDALKIIGTALNKDQYTVYGFHINGNEADTSAKVTYLKDAVGMTPAHMNFGGVFDYGSWENAFFMPRPCMLKYDGTVDYYLDPNDYGKKADGSGSDVANTNYEGNAMMEWGQNGKKIWMKIVPSSDGVSASYFISDVQADKDFKCYPFINNQSRMVDHFYTPIYNGSLVDGKMRSLSGQMPMHNTNATQEVNYAKANNLVPENVIWNTEVLADIQLINVLTVLISKSTQSQAKFGYGQATYDSSETTYYGIAQSGTMDKKGMFWGNSNGQPTPEDPACGVKIFGMEHWWGNIWRRYAGHLLVNGKHKFKMTYGTYDGSTALGYNTTGTGYLENSRPISEASGWIKQMVHDPICGMLPIDLTGQDRKYYSDYTWVNANGTMYAYRGGDVYYGSHMGLFYLGLVYSSGGSYWHIGSALSAKPLA